MKTRKELKEEYKRMKFRMGVFQIVNKVNGKIYIGNSPDLVAKWNSEKFQLEAGLHSNENLQKEWNLYGPENFTYEVLDELQQKEDKVVDYDKEMKDLEELYIEEMKSSGAVLYNKKKLK